MSCKYLTETRNFGSGAMYLGSRGLNVRIAALNCTTQRHCTAHTCIRTADVRHHQLSSALCSQIGGAAHKTLEHARFMQTEQSEILATPG